MIADILLLAGAGLALLIGLAGCIVPIIPGVPLAWAGLLLAFFSSKTQISFSLLIICLITAVAVSIIDNLAPILLTKKSGGSKAGTIGATLGLIAGIFLGPIGIILGPFAGAFVGELMHDRSNTQRAFKATMAAFGGFLLGTGIKLISVGFVIWIFVRALM